MLTRFDYSNDTGTLVRRREMLRECDTMRAKGHRVAMCEGVMTIYGKPPDPRPMVEFSPAECEP